MEITIKGDAKEIAALVLAVQERRHNSEFMLVREPYRTSYSVVKLNPGVELPLGAKT